jgi:hypothetical protein
MKPVGGEEARTQPKALLNSPYGLVIAAGQACPNPRRVGVRAGVNEAEIAARRLIPNVLNIDP